MIKSLTFSPGARARMEGYGFGEEELDHIAHQLSFTRKEFANGKPFTIHHCGMIFTIKKQVVVDVALVNPHEFDAEGVHPRSLQLRLKVPPKSPRSVQKSPVTRTK